MNVGKSKVMVGSSDRKMIVYSEKVGYPDIRYLTHSTIGHRGKLNTHYHQTTYPSSPQLTYDMTTDYNKTEGLSTTTRKLTIDTTSLRPPYPPTSSHPCLTQNK